ncbi:uncharacterized protein ACLA_040090 [Aspergillus clavatus NRRL 1]|uniref:C6 zinc finger domain protein n=1 Tax=Aspergillus clavatus (strain ATCC 1007 / CBS 513.65 / DSM 816 / NCTC 3887 / NRRL 1 / QM 1276 / 107) TaxID=344612 RepID=A1CKW9_ASPCL|nr:C6 zinc finger domain protein [Aspergillus clavatus NRRL 1]EAW09793.1 C6 zinc finger domain protein [Aspergillus clavatus NRRL 1]
MSLAASSGRSVRKRNVVSRGRTGCLTCRRRRLKCDETKPGCNNCRRINQPCEGYAQRITFKDQTNLIVARANGRNVGKRGRSSGSKSEKNGDPDSTFIESSSQFSVTVKGPPSPPPSESPDARFVDSLTNEDTSPRVALHRDPTTPDDSDTEHHVAKGFDNNERLLTYSVALESSPNTPSISQAPYMIPPSRVSAHYMLSPGRILHNSSLSSIGVFEFPEDHTYFEYSAKGQLSSLSKILPLSDFLQSRPMSPYVYSAAMGLAALTLSALQPSRKASVGLRRHAFHHTLRAVQGLNSELSLSCAVGNSSHSWKDETALSFFAATMLLANFELQRGALLSWRSHMQGAALCLSSAHKQLVQTPTGMLLVIAFARMALLLRLYNRDYSVTTAKTMPTRISEWLDLLLRQSSQLRDRMLLLVEEVTTLEIEKRQQPELDNFWSSKSMKLLCKLDGWRDDLPFDEVPVDEDSGGAYLTISSPDQTALIRVPALVFPNATDQCTSAVNYAAYLCTGMRARTRYLPDAGRILPPDAEQTALTICRIAAGIPPTRFGESFTYSYGMLPSVVGAYRWSENPGLRNWVKHWLAGYQGPREGIWNIHQTLRLLATMDSQLLKAGCHFIAMRVIDEPQEPSSELDESRSNEPFKVVLHTRMRDGTSTNVMIVR